jgi:adenosylcobinamide-phosphate synthase
MEWHLFPGEWYLDAGALVLALALDLAFRELPSAVHPVVWMGRIVSWLERIGPSPEAKWLALGWGAVMALAVPALFGGVVWVAANGLRELGPIPYLVGATVLLSTTFAVKGLAQAANGVRDAMDEGSIGDARYGLRSLVSRDAGSLDQSFASAAAIESVAENTTDSYIGPWLAFALLGLPGAFAYRAVNTLDSMIGYRGKYEYLGKTSARLDDVMNLVPARLSAGLIVVAGGLCRMPAGRGLRGLWQGRRLTASPNAGWTIGAMSGLLGVALEKAGHYCIGDGLDSPAPGHIGASVRVAFVVAAIGAPLAIGVLVLRGMVAG